MASKKQKSSESKLNTFSGGPDERGHFGMFGGRYVAETLMPLILDLEKAYDAAKNDPSFQAELTDLLLHYGGRPSPLYYAERLTEHFRQVAGGKGGAKIYFKRDELNHTGSHKINNCLGQIQLARRMGKTRIIAETGAGSTASPSPPCALASACRARSTWVPPTSSGSRPMSCACTCWAPRSIRSRPAPGRSRTP